MYRKFLISITIIIIIAVAIFIFTNISPQKMLDSENDNFEKYNPSYEISNRDPQKVNIEVLKNSIKRNEIKILITDNNDYKYGWSHVFRVQKKVDGNWQEIERITEDMNFYTEAYEFDKNNQLIMDLNCEKYYGILENGIYRIVKPVHSREYFLIELYSNEFEIK